MAVDVIVIGSGPGGAWVARDLAESGLKVKVFEAGPRHNPDTDFKEDVIEMWGFFGWKGQRVKVGQGVGNMSTGVGGSTLDYWGMSPQPQNFSIEEWPSVLLDDMFDTTQVHPDFPASGYYKPIKFFKWIDDRIPIDTSQDRPISCGAQLCIKAANELGLTAGRAPAAMLPPKYARVDDKGYPLEGCVGCAHCTIGCRRPLQMPLHAKAKRTMQVAAIAFAEMYDCEVVPNAHVTRITTDGGGAANGVEYKIKGDPTTYSETAHVVFLGGGAIESPRLYLNSGLPEPNPSMPQVGHWLTDHQQSEVAFFSDYPETLPFTGNFVGSFITNATPTDQLDGIIEAIGGGFPMVGVNVALANPQKDPDNLSQPHPTRPLLWGQELKTLMARFRDATGMGTQTNDEMIYENKIAVSASIADEYGPIAELHYEPTPLTMERHERQTARKVDICRQAGGSNVEIIMNYPGGSGSHPMSTLRMGDSPTNSVCDWNHECWTVPRLYICDASCLPNGLGGSNPARTINAFASRSAYYAMQKYFPAVWHNRTWSW